MKSDQMIRKDVVIPYLKVPCPGCSSPNWPLFTELWEWQEDEGVLKDSDPWFRCPRCEWTFELRDHAGFWREVHKGPLNGGKDKDQESKELKEKAKKLFPSGR